MNSTSMSSGTEFNGGRRINELSELRPFVGKDVAFTLVDDVNGGQLCFGRLSDVSRFGVYTINLYLKPGAGDGCVGVSDLNSQRLVLRQATPDEISGLRLSYS